MPRTILLGSDVYKEQGHWLSTPSYTTTFQLTEYAGLSPGVIFFEEEPGVLGGGPLGVGVTEDLP